MEDDLNFILTEDTLNILVNGRQLHSFLKWKTTSIFKMGDNLILKKWKMTSICIQMEDDLNIPVNKRRP